LRSAVLDAREGGHLEAAAVRARGQAGGSFEEPAEERRASRRLASSTRRRWTYSIGGTPAALVKRRLKVRSARPERRIISSTGAATEKWVESQSCAAVTTASP
jgi:hypothetical protein